MKDETIKHDNYSKIGLATHCNKGYNSYKKIFARLFKEMQYFTLQCFDRICGNLAQILTGTAPGSNFKHASIICGDLAQTLTDTGQISSLSWPKNLKVGTEDN
ncbi:hypothetical protein K435DRAFT_802964 [Dendrothele bispora CBS 962.96]|uniref:Uncharacterized protein n=1 Tax=Dendrothele bispora (strain CBS 962.96) TaxID=1314807 RepID=A0A4V4HE26_DENBC|nr:hypothetical protein K435DRAFT_802964 [Dendrothele bispora CBS 962.96]